jgi:hypothetical protein
MTIVVARKFGQRVLIVSDTMISETTAARQNIIPGTLKSIVISMDFSLAFSGNIATALDAIRETKEIYARRKNSDLAIDKLCEMSVRSAKTDQDCDFLAVRHLSTRAELIRISGGKATVMEMGTFIGQPSVWEYLMKAERDIPLDESISRDEYSSPEEIRFQIAVNSLRIAPAEHASIGVGGFIITLLCSPHGHCYSGNLGVHAWDKISIPGGLTDAQIADRASGKTEYRYRILPPSRRGVAVVGAMLDQAKLGFVYSPLSVHSIPAAVTDATESRIRQLVDAEAEQQGGILVEE